MFADPQTVTVNAVAKVMARVLISGTSATYQTADENWKLTISHLRSKGRIRTMVRLDQRAIVPDPLTAVNDFETLTDYHVIDRPEVGSTLAQIQQQCAGLNAWFDATAIGKLVGGES
jgi:hypothetical protein